jgi:hypothetical protein
MLVYDINQIKRYYDLYYNNTQNDEYKFMMALCCRNKYVDYPIDNVMVHRQVVDYNEHFDKFMQKLYVYCNDNAFQFPNEAKVIYISLNPSSMFKSYVEFNEMMMKKLTSLSITVKDDIPQIDKSGFSNMNHDLLTCIQKNIIEKRWLLLDIDTKDATIVAKINEYLITNKIKVNSITETRGGFHYIINQFNLTNEQKKNIFTGFIKDMKKREKNKKGDLIDKNVVDIFASNILTVMPGTIQGGFHVKFIEIPDNL